MSEKPNLVQIIKNNQTPLSRAVVFSTFCADKELAEQAAAELAALRSELDVLKLKLDTAQKTAIYFSELGHGVRPSLRSVKFIEIYKREQAAAIAGNE